MKTNRDYRDILAEIGVDDDRAERAITDMLREKDTQLQLERDRVPEQVWALEDRLMKMGVAR